MTNSEFVVGRTFELKREGLLRLLLRAAYTQALLPQFYIIVYFCKCGLSLSAGVSVID